MNWTIDDTQPVMRSDCGYLIRRFWIAGKRRYAAWAPGKRWAFQYADSAKELQAACEAHASADEAKAACEEVA